LVGLKKDLEASRKAPKEETNVCTLLRHAPRTPCFEFLWRNINAQRLAEEMNVNYFELSAKSGSEEQIAEPFIKLLELLRTE